MSERLNLDCLSSCNNYNEWIYSFIRPHVKGRILEVGSGIGTFTKYLPKRHLTCIEIDDHFARLLADYYPESYIVKGDVETMNVDDAFDTVVCINVLDHVQNDMMAIHNMIQSLTKTGKLILIVPIGKWLYREHGVFDQSVGHYRRYNKFEIFNKVAGAGGVVLGYKYINMIGILSWWWQFNVMKRKELSKSLEVQDMLIPMVAWFEKKVNIPVGLSMMVVVERRV